ncbi:Rv2175c family DNA-binding protein [Corynebacterium pygosceleis]|uniref:Rv2175c family DNA-binding protein n=1 Tax=Corynebacterium pygosceleis TaxID=2800406 RepID=A0A9Q4C6U2_9CORY|nr:Rv2175c family DNA-binding protein [Corynebacterium pygosceleis]MCK7636633.1 Rv2175c family DNA-binding protein [Corynebacterium pygosceleis]MCK7675207.1 Rv2175c family DNA-binding protein [Corynebacterium pygosceleis]MCL0120578.1 Rv2175c family DNA-binding protein [Corynebacterium pygosceleis]MCX7444129.1 Rv2175c family DNA-binding protein [Corynebacterium pygosceleis]MCX7467386.1 Rv2175c family DNA-binding protein [Corynebacterium pygosceleis]
MSSPEAREVLSTDEPLLSVPEAAETMGVVVTRVYDLLGEHKLIAVTVDGQRMLPAVFFDESGRVNRFVPGVIALLSDGGYDDREILDWLFTPDDSLPGRPVDGLHGHLAREVMRRAQAAGL